MPKLKKISPLPGKWKGIKNKRQGEIYHWAKKELYKEQVIPKIDWVDHTPTRQEKEIYAQNHYQTWKINRQQRNYLLKETARLYREEIHSQKGQILWYQEQAGFTQPSSRRIKKNQKVKLIFPEPGEHKEFHARKKSFWQIWKTKVQSRKGSLTDKKDVEHLTHELYHASPRRLRDRFLDLTEDQGTTWNLSEFTERYLKKNPFPATRRHYIRSMQKMIRQDFSGEKVPDQEISIDKYGRPTLQKGQVIQFGSIFSGLRTPGKGWSIYRKVPTTTEREQKLHGWAHQGYIEEYGTELEKWTWRMKKDKGLCWVEAVLGQSCEENQGTSSWFCLTCVTYGEYHPPVLPRHCSWKYTYKTWLCGNKQHSDANKQWHFSVEGEMTRDKIKGGDWGSCHIGVWQKPRKQTKRK